MFEGDFMQLHILVNVDKFFVKAKFADIEYKVANAYILLVTNIYRIFVWTTCKFI